MRHAIVCPRAIAPGVNTTMPPFMLRRSWSLSAHVALAAAMVLTMVVSNVESWCGRVRRGRCCRTAFPSTAAVADGVFALGAVVVAGTRGAG